MSSNRRTPPVLPPPWAPSHQPVQTQQPSDEHGPIVFRRQLWQRTMPDGTRTELGVSDRSHAQSSHSSRSGSVSSRRASTASVRSLRRSLTPTEAPLTPEESPLVKTARKRSVADVDDDNASLKEVPRRTSHARTDSTDSAVHVCICQPEPKIPRPRNAFILYRQHHQARVVAQHPGLANPEISKIIGEQWQSQPTEIRNKWKALAEEEKRRHHQQYPNYKYQPRRNGRRNSLSADSPTSAGPPRAKCPKCGGRSILTPSLAYGPALNTHSSPLSAAPNSAATPISRTLPHLRDLSLQSPAYGGPSFGQPGGAMSPHIEDRDELGPMSPGAKRRRYNNDVPPAARAMPSARYGVPQTPGPNTPHPFAAQHPYPPAIAHARRESLPGIRHISNPPTPMGPPPRPTVGYQQHRLSQGHVGGDRSLALPPLQTNTANLNGNGGALQTATSVKIPAEPWSFRNKIRVLSQIAPPASLPQHEPRGPLIAIEGDDAAAVKELAQWLYDELRKGDDLSLKLVEGPDVGSQAEKKKAMVQYHGLVSEWLVKSDNIVDNIKYRSAPSSKNPSPNRDGPRTRRALEENYDDEDDKSRQEKHGNDKMDLDKTPTTAKLESLSGPKPVGIVANYSLRASNVYAVRIPVTPNEMYGPNDHWSWAATQWRGIVGPDLTVYVRDTAAGEPAKPAVEMTEEGNLFVIKRTRTEGDRFRLEIEPAALRRLAFELSEWVRAFGSYTRGSQ